MSPNEEIKMRYLLGYLDGISDVSKDNMTVDALMKAVGIVKELLGEKEDE